MEDSEKMQMEIDDELLESVAGGGSDELFGKKEDPWAVPGPWVAPGKHDSCGAKWPKSKKWPGSYPIKACPLSESHRKRIPDVCADCQRNF